ncbi:MAG: hypothetical protein QOE70_4282 [Chthoniobacter sp.]|nr:hypothetical protein [Chthoniobacter sp.]
MTILVLAFCFTSALAQAPIFSRRPVLDQAPAWPENYQLILSVFDKDKLLHEISVLVASLEFRADSFDPTLTFQGTLVPAENGSFVLRYAVTAEIAVPTEPGTVPIGAPPVPAGRNVPVQFKTQTAQSTVRVRPGQPIEILKTGDRIYRIFLTRHAAPADGAR